MPQITLHLINQKKKNIICIKKIFGKTNNNQKLIFFFYTYNIFIYGNNKKISKRIFINNALWY